MPRFQPGAHRYFGTTPQPVSSVTARVLPFLQKPTTPGFPMRPPLRSMRPTKPVALVIGKPERGEITKRLLKMPSYIPAATSKGLKVYAQSVMADKKAHTREEVVFAEATVHPEQAIKNQTRQKQYVKGEVEALVGIDDRHIRGKYAFSHHPEEVAGQTLRKLVKEKTDAALKPTIRERRAQASGGGDATTAPSSGTPAWSAPTPLGPNAGTKGSSDTGWSAPFAPLPGGVHAQDVHALGAAPTLRAGAQLEIMIVSDRYQAQQVPQWSSALGQRCGILALGGLALMATSITPPRRLLIDACGDVPAFDPTAINPQTSILFFRPPELPPLEIATGPMVTIVPRELTIPNAIEILRQLAEKKKG